MNFDLTDIIEAVIALLGALATTFLIPYLKSRLSKEKQESLAFWVKTAAQAAEQLYGSKKGQQKKEYVVSFLLSKGIVVDIDEVTALMESEVYRLSQGKNKSEI